MVFSSNDKVTPESTIKPTPESTVKESPAFSREESTKQEEELLTQLPPIASHVPLEFVVVSS